VKRDNNTTTKREKKMPRIEMRTGVDGQLYFCVIVPSPVVDCGIIQGEWLTREQAEEDLKNWM